ncbi:MAG: hypothetical protein P8181_02150, partial [bacterium]
MSKLPVALCLCLMLSSTLLAAPAAANSERSRRLDIYMPDDGPTQRVYFYSEFGDEKALISLFHRLVKNGAKHVNCFLPNTLVCELPVGQSAQAYARDPGITVLADAQVEETSSPGQTFSPGWAKRCYAIVEK